MSTAIAQEIVERTRLFMALDEDTAMSALDACRACIDADPDGPIGAAGRITAIVASAYFGWLKRTGEWPSLDDAAYDQKFEAARFVTEQVTPVLANGLVTAARSRDDTHQADMRRLLVALADREASILQRLFDEAQIETDALLIDGKTEAQVDGKTKEDVYDEAQTFYDAWVDGDLAGALRGFTRLRRFNPLDTYFRNMRGAILSAQGKTKDAVREFLYAFRLDAGDAMVAANLVRACAALNFNAAAVEIGRHYGRHRRESPPEQSERQIDVYTRFSAVLLQTVACAAARVGPKEFDPGAADALDVLPSHGRPWLTDATEAMDIDHSALHGARLFLSYRRADGAALVQRLHRRLKSAHPSLHVFLDEAAMVGGEDFAGRIREEIERSDAFVLVIGSHWAAPAGIARLHETADLVRREVAWALHKGIPIVPVLLNDTPMPKAGALPELLRPVVANHAERLGDGSFDNDLRPIEASLNRVIAARLARKRATDEAADEIFATAESDTEEAHRKFGELVEDWKETLPLVMTVEGAPGAGIKADVELNGVWECAVTGADGWTSFRLVLEPPKHLTGEWRRHSEKGRVLERQSLRGIWAKVKNEAGGGLLGLYLKYVLDEKTPLFCTIPFHERIGDTLVGVDDSGRRYVSRNVETRVRGF